jgi:broad specificity phosphatase PhoE
MVLVVAHNAINQGLLGTALGLPPSFFRCFVQSNAAFTVVDFQPNGAAPPRATLERMNRASPHSSPPPKVAASAGDVAYQDCYCVRTRDDGGSRVCADSPESPFKVGDSRKSAVRMVLVMASEQERLSPLGRVQVRKTAELLMDVEVSTIACADATCARDSAEEIGMLQELAGHTRPRLHGLETVEDAPQGTAGGVYARLKAMCGQDDTLVVVGDASMVASVLADATHMGEQGMGSFRIDACSISVLDFPDGVEHRAVVKCTNYTAHFGRFAVPLAALGDR